VLLWVHQGKTIIKVSTHPAFHGYGKNKKNALQVSKCPLVLHAKPVVMAIRTSEIHVLA